MITVYCEENTPRIGYTFRLIFETLLNDSVTICIDEATFESANGPKINYSNNNELSGLYLQPSRLLLEHHLQEQFPKITDWDGTKALFPVEDSFLPFDIFAATFYMVTRYEEYLPGNKDNHNRFRARKSLAAINGFLEKPVVNIWALKLAEVIEGKYTGHRFKRSKFKYVPTIDIDNAWAFKNKGFVRTTLSFAKDILKGRWKTFRKRFAVVNLIEKDPYDSYKFMKSVFKEHGFRPTYFFLLNKKGKHDRSLSHKNLSYRSLILKLGKQGKIGIHPSYASNKRDRQLIKEIKRFVSITGKQPKRSRQHYLKMTLPTTYRRLIENGILADYSMGFPTRPGFRAGIATPFMFFDILDDKETNLKVHPFQVMDVTLLHYRGMRAVDAIRKIKNLMDETAAVGGTFVSLWHNESLSDHGHWKGWQNVYTEMTAYAAKIRDEKTTELNS